MVTGPSGLAISAILKDSATHTVVIESSLSGWRACNHSEIKSSASVTMLLALRSTFKPNQIVRCSQTSSVFSPYISSNYQFTYVFAIPLSLLCSDCSSVLFHFKSVNPAPSLYPLHSPRYNSPLLHFRLPSPLVDLCLIKLTYPLLSSTFAMSLSPEFSHHCLTSSFSSIKSFEKSTDFIAPLHPTWGCTISSASDLPLPLTMAKLILDISSSTNRS